MDPDPPSTAAMSDKARANSHNAHDDFQLPYPFISTHH